MPPRMNSQLIVGALKRCHSNFEVRALASNSSVAFHELQDYQPDVVVGDQCPIRGFAPPSRDSRSCIIAARFRIKQPPP